MASNTKMGRVGNLEKEMEEVKIKLEKVTEMEKKMECLTQGIARILSALEDTNKILQPAGKNIPTKKVNSESTPRERTLPEDVKVHDREVIFQSTLSSKERKARKKVPTEAEVANELFMLDAPYVDLPSYPDLGPKGKLMKIKGTIKGKEVVVLIKSDTTHNFISEKLVKELELPTSETRDYVVVIGIIGIEKDRICHYVNLDMPGMTATEHFLPFDLAGDVDVILGSKWLRSLDDVVIYRQNGVCTTKIMEGDEMVLWNACAAL